MSSSGSARSQSDLIQLFDQDVSHLIAALPNGPVEFHFTEEKTARHILYAVRRDVSHRCGMKERQCHHTGMKCYIIELRHAIIDSIWGKGTFGCIQRIHQQNFGWDKFHSHYFSLFEASYFSDLIVRLCFFNPRLKQETLLQNMLHAGGLAFCKKLINNLSDAALNHAGKFSDGNGYNILHDATLCGHSDICLLIINRLSRDVFNQLVTSLCKNEITLNDPYPHSLIMALMRQPTEICLALIKKMSSDTLNSLLLLKDVDGVNSLYIASILPESVFTSLIIRSSNSHQLASAACVMNSDNQSTFQTAAQYQSAKSFKMFLSYLDSPVSKKVVHEFFKKNRDTLYQSFRLVALYQSVENCQLFLALFDDDKPLSKTLFNLCKKNINHYSLRSALRAIQFKLNASLTVAAMERESKEAPHVRASLARLLELLRSFDVDKTLEDKKEYYWVSVAEKTALQHFNSGVWVKIVRAENDDKNNRDFIDHLFNPKNRQKLRRDEIKQGYKLLLSPVEKKSDDRKAETIYESKDGFARIVEAATPSGRACHKTNKKYDASSKHPVTFVSADTPTGLFGMGAGRLMVGYALRVNQEKIKLLSTQDCGTFRRWWYSKKRNILLHELSRARNFICKRFSEFEMRVKQQPFVVNEALVKLNKQDLFAIVIADDTPEARKMAVQRKNDLIDRYSRRLPIIFYNPEKRTRATIYTSAEQRHDFPELFLSELKDALQKQRNTCWDSFASLWSKPKMLRIAIDFTEYLITQAEAREILGSCRASIFLDVNERRAEVAKLLGLVRRVTGIGKSVLDVTERMCQF